MIRYRVKQISKNEFIPQVQKGFGNRILNRWATILTYKYFTPDAYFYGEYIGGAILCNYQKALDAIVIYKTYLIQCNEELKEQKQYPKIYKIL